MLRSNGFTSKAFFLFATNNAILTQRHLPPDRGKGILGILVSQVEPRLTQWTIRMADYKKREKGGSRSSTRKLKISAPYPSPHAY